MAVLDDCVITAEAPTTTGTTTIDSAAYDMTGFEEITFVVRLGTAAANTNIRVRQDDATGGSYADLVGTLVNSATLNQHMVTVVRPGKRFVKCRVTRGTTTTIDSLVAIQSRGGLFPVTQPATSVSEKHYSPAEGTA